MSIRETIIMARQCLFCTKPFEARRIDQAYCSATCSRAGDSLEMKRARRLYRALYHWRLRNPANMAENLRFICREIRSWVLEDRAMGRRPPPVHQHDADRGHQRRPSPLVLRGPE